MVLRRPVAPPSGGGKKKKRSGFFGSLTDFAGGAFNIGKPATQASRLAELIEKQAAVQKNQALQKSMVNDPTLFQSPFQTLQDQLFSAANSINVAPTPLEELQRIANQQVAAQYDPQISGLMAEMQAHDRRAKSSQKQAKEMYGGLAQDYLSQLPELTQQFKAEDDANAARYDEAQQSMDQEYDKQAAEQAAVLKRLGVQAAAPDASQQAMEDQAYFQNQSKLDEQAAASALNEQQNAQMDYQRNLGSNAKMAGANVVQDLQAELNDYLTQAGSQKNALEASKSSAIAALLGQLQQQDAERVANQRQQEFENTMQMFKFQLDAQKAAQAAAAESNVQGAFGDSSSLTTGLAGAQNYLASQYPDQPIMASNLMEQLNDVLSNKAVTQGKFVIDPGDPSMGKSPKYSDVGQEYMMDLLRSEFEKEGSRYGTGDINATMNALLAYLGKLR